METLTESKIESIYEYKTEYKLTVAKCFRVQCESEKVQIHQNKNKGIESVET